MGSWYGAVHPSHRAMMGFGGRVENERQRPILSGFCFLLNCCTYVIPGAPMEQEAHCQPLTYGGKLTLMAQPQGGGKCVNLVSDI